MGKNLNRDTGQDVINEGTMAHQAAQGAGTERVRDRGGHKLRP